MTTKDTREDVEKRARLLKDELASGMLLRLLDRAETAEAAMETARAIASCHHPKTHGSYELILHEIRNLAALAEDKEAG